MKKELIIPKKDLIRMGCRAYGKISKSKKRIGKSLIFIALLPLCSLWLFPIGMKLMGIPFGFLLKTWKIEIKQRLRLR